MKKKFFIMLLIVGTTVFAMDNCCACLKKIFCCAASQEIPVEHCSRTRSAVEMPEDFLQRWENCQLNTPRSGPADQRSKDKVGSVRIVQNPAMPSGHRVVRPLTPPPRVAPVWPPADASSNQNME